VSRADALMLMQQSYVGIDPRAPGYILKSGTSQATPHVAAAAAKIWAARPSCTSSQIRLALESTAFDLGAYGRDDEYGYGLVQVANAYQYLLGMAVPCGLVIESETTEEIILLNATSSAQGTQSISKSTYIISGIDAFADRGNRTDRIRTRRLKGRQ
jgi:hypothetical protein